jgi:DNA ligase-1
LKGLKSLKVQVGVPIMPALCQRLPNTEKMIEKMGEVAGEPKYDGARLQIHFNREKKWEQKEDQLAFDFQPKGFVRMFTRNLENVTHMFPDLVQALFKEVKAKELILDGEAIGVDPKTGKLLPFQETIKRKRKYGIGRKAEEIPLKYFAFDLLLKDGKDLLQVPFEKRRKALEKTLRDKNGTIVLSPQIVTQDPVVLRKYHEEQFNLGLEGVVVKKWQAPYDPGKRGYTWVKLKQEKGKKGGGLADTLDCVVMGYYQGRGKRAEFGIGMFLVGVRNKGKIVTVSKIGTGLTDDQWREMKQRCEKVKTDQKPKSYQVPKDLAPGVWCRPKIVVEIEADNITKSPLHTAKYALRFPRLVRFRDDKSPSQATTLKETEKLYQLQK